MSKVLLFLPGDGIGPEVCDQARRVTEWLIRHADLDLRIESADIGGTAYDRHGRPLPDATKAAALAADAVLVGAVGGPKWVDVPRQVRPELGLLALRQAMGVYANLRPAFAFAPLVDASTLKREVVEGLDLIMVRELLGGVYFGEPRGRTRLANGDEEGKDTQIYTTPEIVRIARTAFELARTRRNKVTSVDKANVMESGLLWREVVTQLHAAEYGDVELDHMYADNCGMQLVRHPKQFDVLVADNLFGDLLSDVSAMLAGSLGMLPSASLAGPGKPGLYEPIHGSAPDIAGKGLANPLATILSLEMALRHSLDRTDVADRLRAAVAQTLAAGAGTADIGGDLSTEAMGAAVIAALDGAK
jgi:3-isopropylmalate dehydrogenase